MLILAYTIVIALIVAITMGLLFDPNVRDAFISFLFVLPILSLCSSVVWAIYTIFNHWKNVGG